MLKILFVILVASSAMPPDAGILVDPAPCSVATFLANGIPDIPMSVDWGKYNIAGSTKSVLTQYDTTAGRPTAEPMPIPAYDYVELGTYSHTADGVSYYINGDNFGCEKARQAQITWKCGNRHSPTFTDFTVLKQCEYHFEIEIQCCVNGHPLIQAMPHENNFVGEPSTCQNNDYGNLPDDYNGNISVTKSGYTCQLWATETPHKPNYRPENPADARNYCRGGLDGDLTGAWCYTTNPENRWEYCSCTQVDDENSNGNEKLVEDIIFDDLAVVAENYRRLEDLTKSEYYDDYSNDNEYDGDEYEEYVASEDDYYEFSGSDPEEIIEPSAEYGSGSEDFTDWLSHSDESEEDNIKKNYRNYQDCSFVSEKNWTAYFSVFDGHLTAILLLVIAIAIIITSIQCDAKKGKGLLEEEVSV